MAVFLCACLSVLILPGCIASLHPPCIPADKVTTEVPYLWPGQDGRQLVHSEEGGDVIPGIQNGIIAVVKTRVVTLNEFDYVFEQALNQKGAKVSGEELYESVLNELVEKLLLLELAKEKNVEVQDREVEQALESYAANFSGDKLAFESALEKQGQSLEAFRDQIRESLVIKTLDRSLYAGVEMVTPGDLLAYYKAHLDNYRFPERRRISMILLFKDKYKDGEQARRSLEKLRERIVAGEDFATLAAVSDLPSSSKGGDLGWVVRGDMAAAIEEMAFSMSQGELSRIGETPEGVFILRCEEISPAHTRDFDSVQDQISKSMRTESQEKHRRTVVDGLLSQAFVRKLPAEEYVTYRRGLQPR
ncbi:MAG: peptidyl-prolyl cis-trans isomerase [Planctomycetes bacterium]|nr:peptidyl-prolyl cis-trans isomerase [Planctomycetota bacterium]